METIQSETTKTQNNEQSCETSIRDFGYLYLNYQKQRKWEVKKRDNNWKILKSDEKHTNRPEEVDELEAQKI